MDGRRAVRIPRIAQKPRIRRRRHRSAGSRDRSRHGHLLGCGRGTPPPSAVSRTRPSGASLEPGRERPLPHDPDSRPGRRPVPRAGRPLRRVRVREPGHRSDPRCDRADARARGPGDIRLLRPPGRPCADGSDLRTGRRDRTRGGRWGSASGSGPGSAGAEPRAVGADVRTGRRRSRSNGSDQRPSHPGGGRYA